jgi:hypothetical protein
MPSNAARDSDTADKNTQEQDKLATAPKKTRQAREDDEHIVPHNNLPLVFVALMLTAFLVRISFCVSSFLWLILMSRPRSTKLCTSRMKGRELVKADTILKCRDSATDHGCRTGRRQGLFLGRKVVASQVVQFNVLTFFASAYLIAAAAMSPAYGKLSDICGRKLVLYPSILIFLVCITPLRVDYSPNHVPDRIRTLWCCEIDDLAHCGTGTSRNWGWWYGDPSVSLP